MSGQHLHRGARRRDLCRDVIGHLACGLREHDDVGARAAHEVREVGRAGVGLRVGCQDDEVAG
ncbi:MAG: hypothetical protein H7269_14790 [Cellulomonas sp.]|nr:hypothetical protein [Cellulomonas sp.]